jgi:predicted DNA-binding transcriptional regulator AlpA
VNHNNGLAAAPLPIPTPHNGSATITLPFPTNRLIRWRELREYLGISDAQMHRISNDGQLPPFVRIGRGKFFEPGDIINWLAARKSAA